MESKRPDALLSSFVAWMADKHPKPLGRRTRAEYRWKVEKAMRLAKEGGYSLTRDDVRVLRYVLGRLSPDPTTQRTYLTALTHFYDFLIQSKLGRKDNPARLIGRPPAPNYYPRPIDFDDCKAYLEAAEALGPFCEAIAVLGLYLGLRRAEIARAQWSHFFRAEGRLWMDITGKGGKRARQAVPKRVVELLVKLRHHHNDPTWLFPSPVKWGSHISLQWVDRKHHEICDSAGIEGVVLHQLRHSYATYLHRKTGAEGPIVQRGMRHANYDTTRVYMEILDTELAEFMDQLDYGERGHSATS